MNDRIRVLVVDDSAFARKVLREVLATSAGIEVVGHARDGLEALEQIAALAPDVVTLDLVMPNLDGVGVLRDLPRADRPAVVVVSISDGESELAVEALALGAFDYVRKPTSLATERLYELGGELVRKVLAAGTARRRRPSEERTPASVDVPPGAAPVSFIAIGASTGGPQALTQLVPALPPDAPPVAIALHIPAEYTAPMAARLHALARLRVVEAREGLEFVPGLVALAHGGSDLRIERRGERLVAHLVREAQRMYHPSVDALFESAARACGASLLGVVLTGMGDDGLAGARAIRAAGGRVLVEAASSAVVDGMPRCVREAGLADAEVALGDMATAIARQLRP